MKGLKKLINRRLTDKSRKTTEKYNQLQKLIKELRKRELGEKTTADVNGEIMRFNQVNTAAPNFDRSLKQTQSAILQHLRENLNLVPKNHYRDLWLVLGMTALGIPLGVIFGVGFADMAFIAIGMPCGMALGIGIGVSKDKKAKKDGRQLDITS